MDLGKVVAHIQADISDFKTNIEFAKQEASSFGDKLGGMVDDISSFATQAAVVVGAQAFLFQKIAGDTINYASNLEQARIAYDAFTGSAEKGGKALSEVTEFARKTPFQLPEVVDAGKQLLGFGFKVDDLTTKLSEVGSLAAATHTPMSVAIDLFARAREGMFNLREFGQFGISREALEQFGVSFSKTGAVVNQSELLPALEKLIKSRFGSVLQQESQTFGGTVTNIKDDFGRLAASFIGVDAATGAIIKGGLFEKLKNGVKDIYTFIEAHMDMVKKIGSNKTVQLAIEGFVIALGSLVIILPIVIAALNPVVLIVLAIEAAIVALYLAWNTNFLGIRDITKTVFDFISMVVKDLIIPLFGVLVAAIKNHWFEISTVTQGVWNIIVGILKLALGIITTIIATACLLMSGDFDKAGKFVIQSVNLMGDGLKQIFTGIIDMIIGFGAGILHHMVSPFEDAWNKIKGLMNNIKDALDFTKRHSPSVLDIVNNGVSLVNDAFDKLNFGVNMSAPQIASSLMPVGVGSMQGISISLDGAIIADEQSARRMAEKLGDYLLAKMKTNIRA